jgi:hypothetical protein
MDTDFQQKEGERRWEEIWPRKNARGAEIAEPGGGAGPGGGNVESLDGPFAFEEINGEDALSFARIQCAGALSTFTSKQLTAPSIN